MFARYSVTSYGRIEPERAFRIADELDPLYREQAGCLDVRWLYDEVAGEYGAFVLWESEAALTAAAQALQPTVRAPWAREGIAPTGAFAPKTYRVYEPRR
jgi:hypothetical protein